MKNKCVLKIGRGQGGKCPDHLVLSHAHWGAFCLASDFENLRIIKPISHETIPVKTFSWILVFFCQSVTFHFVTLLAHFHESSRKSLSSLLTSLSVGPYHSLSILSYCSKHIDTISSASASWHIQCTGIVLLQPS